MAPAIGTMMIGFNFHIDPQAGSGLLTPDRNRRISKSARPAPINIGVVNVAGCMDCLVALSCVVMLL